MKTLIRRGADTLIAFGLWFRTLIIARFFPAGIARHPDTKCILFIAEILPPHTRVGVYRPLSWIQGACERGWDVIAVSHPHYGAPTDAGAALLKRIPPQLKRCDSPRRRLHPFIRLTPFMAVHLLSGLQMFLDARKALLHRPDFIVATGPNFDTFIAGLYLARFYRSKLILDYRDEWTLHPLAAWSNDKTTRQWEERCLRQADLIIHTTKRQMDHHLAHFPFIPPHRERVILNGCDPTDLLESAVGAPERDPGAPLHMLYAGTAVAINGPAGFLADLEQLLEIAPIWQDKLRIKFVGDRWGAREEELCRKANQNVVQRSPAVPKGEVPAMIADADALLLFLPPQMERYIPTKLFEYIGSGKPILVHGHDGEIADIVRDLDAGAVVSAGDPDALAAALDEFLTRPAAHWQSEKRRRWAEAHLRARSAERFYVELEGLAS